MRLNRMRIVAAVVVLALFGIAHAQSQKSSSPRTEVLEVVTFRLQPGVSEQQFLAENRKVESSHVSKQPGFISRETAKGDKGEWLVFVRRKSLKDAEASMASFAAAPGTEGFMKAIDPASMSMKRYVKTK